MPLKKIKVAEVSSTYKKNLKHTFHIFLIWSFTEINGHIEFYK